MKDLRHPDAPPLLLQAPALFSNFRITYIQNTLKYNIESYRIFVKNYLSFQLFCYKITSSLYLRDNVNQLKVKRPSLAESAMVH